MDLEFWKTKVPAMKYKTFIFCYKKIDGMHLDNFLVFFLPLNSNLIYKKLHVKQKTTPPLEVCK